MRLTGLVLTVFSLVLSVVAAMAAPPPVALDMRIAGDDSVTRIVIEFDRPIEVSHQLLDRPWRLVLDFNKIGYGFSADSATASGLVSGLRYGDMAGDHSRIIFQARRPFKVRTIGTRQDEQNGRYNLVVPSTFTTNLPQPSGMSPNMLVSCMNDAGIGPEPDPFWNPQFSQFCYTFQYMPGAITYLDTPVEPIAAFASPVTYPVDCERPASTPMIKQVTRSDLSGPYALPGESVQIDSMGLTQVDNPDWGGDPMTPRKIDRDYSFNDCTVELEDVGGARRWITSAAVQHRLPAMCLSVWLPVPTRWWSPMLTAPSRRSARPCRSVRTPAVSGAYRVTVAIPSRARSTPPRRVT